jgi:hypothetical protein
VLPATSWIAFALVVALVGFGECWRESLRGLGVSAFAVLVALEHGRLDTFSRHHPRPFFAPTPPPPLAAWGDSRLVLVVGSQLVFGIPRQQRGLKGRRGRAEGDGARILGFGPIGQERFDVARSNGLSCLVHGT